jgi:hypothetical protein
MVKKVSRAEIAQENGTYAHLPMAVRICRKLGAEISALGAFRHYA